MSDTPKKILLGRAQGEITKKKSRFIASVFEIHSEAEALELLESVRKKYYDARHNCYAFVLGSENQLQRFSDDKEPQGTAGKPILEVLTRRNYHNTLIVVTRYFGGILLGTGGLARAYTQAALEGLLEAEKSGAAGEVYSGVPLSILCDYNHSGKIQYLIGQLEVPVEQVLYDAKVTFRIVPPEEQADSLIRKITEATNAAAVITREEEAYFLLSGGTPVRCSL